MARLRAPDGCPWDREQTFDTIKRHTLEEVYEVFDAIERRAFEDIHRQAVFGPVVGDGATGQMRT